MNCERRYRKVQRLDCFWEPRERNCCSTGCRWRGRRQRNSLPNCFPRLGWPACSSRSRLRKPNSPDLIHAFPTGKAKPTELAEPLKTAIADAQGIRVNEVCFVATDSRLKDPAWRRSLRRQPWVTNRINSAKCLNDPKKPAGADCCGGGIEDRWRSRRWRRRSRPRSRRRMGWRSGDRRRQRRIRNRDKRRRWRRRGRLGCRARRWKRIGK